MGEKLVIISVIFQCQDGNKYFCHRKRRYFILRKDIRALHYYSSREDMILLGSIDLSNDIRIVNIRPDDSAAGS
jgi:hypothetical protein